MLVSSPFQRFVQRIARVLPHRSRLSRLRRLRSISLYQNIPAIVETLEGRELLSANAIVVNSVSGSANYASNVTINQLNPGVTPVTLRDAIHAVNNTPGAATISFDSTVFGSGQTTIHLGGSLLELTNTTGKVTIAGSASGQVSVSGDNVGAVFQVDAGVNAEIDSLTITGGSASLGAGINNLGTLTLSGDAVVGNNANASVTANEGGGIANSGNLTLINTTVAGNSASGGVTLDEGGGIFTQSGNVIIIDSTIANNTAIAPIGSLSTAAVGGGIAWTGGNTIKLNGSILAGNTSDVLGSASATSDFFGSAPNIDASASFNLVGDGSNTGLVNGVSHNIVGTSGAGAVNAHLDALANYGGSTQTLALASTSAAIGAGATFNDTNGNPIAFDERGIARVSGSVDIGAYQTAATAISSITRLLPTVNATNADNVTFEVKFNVPVQNVSTGDFTVNAGTVASVTPVNSSTYDVNVDGLGSFTGTLTLGIAGGQNISDLTGLALTVTTPTGANNNTFAIDHTPPASVSFAGEYAVATVGSPTLTLASITQAGTTLTLNGVTTTSATVTSTTQLLVGATTATYGDNVINFGASGTFANQTWTKLSLPANFTNQRGAAVHISQNGAALTFTDSMGTMSSGSWVSPTQISAYGETATIANGQLSWADGSVWYENVNLTGALNGSGTTTITAAPSQLRVVNYTSSNGGASVHVVEMGTNQVIIIDRNGVMGIGTFLNATQCSDSQYPNDLATFSPDGNTVTWQDGTIWTIAGASAQVTVSDYLNTNGVATHLVTNGTAHLAFVDGLGRLSLGTFINANQAISFMYPNDVATIDLTSVIWQDGSIWTKTLNPQLTIAATDTFGAVSHLQLASASTLIGLDGALQGATGTRLNGNIYWSTGDVWNNFDFDSLNAFFEMRATYP